MRRLETQGDLSSTDGRNSVVPSIEGEPRSFAPRDHADAAPGLASDRAGGYSSLAPMDLIPAAASNPVGGREAQAGTDRPLIVIPCLNEAAVIERVIRAILDDDGLSDPLVVVADGGSTDGTRDIVSNIASLDSRVLLLVNPRRLQSAALNLAASSAMGNGRSWLVRVDAHADYPRNYASTLIAEARQTGASSVVVSMETVGEEGFQRAVAAAQNSVLGTGGSAHRSASHAGWVDHGHHAVFSMEDFRQVGGYDETFSHNEDGELDVRLSLQGRRIWLTDKVRIGYYPRSTPSALWKQYVNYGKGRARTVLKHHTPLKIRQAVPLAIAPAAVSALAAPIFWPLAVPALVWLAASLGCGVMLGVRKRDAAIMAAGVAAVIMHLAWSVGFWMQLATSSRASFSHRTIDRRHMSRRAVFSRVAKRTPNR